MFDIGWSEFVVIAVVALIAIGPKELPGALRTLGQWMGKVRRMAGEFQDQFREAMREAEMADIKKDIDEATGKLGSGITDPFKDLHEATEWKPAETSSTPPAADAPPAPPAEAIAAQPATAAPTEPAAAPAAEPAAAAPAPSEPVAAPSTGGDKAA